MAQLTFTATDFIVGAKEHFFAAGEQAEFALRGLDWNDHVPDVRGKRLRWRFSNGIRPMEDYEGTAQLCVWPTGHRREAIQMWTPNPAGYLWNTEDDVLDLAVAFGPESGLMQLLSAACASRTPISFFSNDLYFGAEGIGDAAFPSTDGFLQRHEPCFIGGQPIIRIEGQ